MDKLTVTLNEAAQTLGLSRKSIRALVESGRLPAIRVGDGPRAKFLIPKQGLLEFLSGSRS